MTEESCVWTAIILWIPQWRRSWESMLFISTINEQCLILIKIIWHQKHIVIILMQTTKNNRIFTNPFEILRIKYSPTVNTIFKPISTLFIIYDTTLQDIFRRGNWTPLIYVLVCVYVTWQKIYMCNVLQVTIFRFPYEKKFISYETRVQCKLLWFKCIISFLVTKKNLQQFYNNNLK